MDDLIVGSMLLDKNDGAILEKYNCPQCKQLLRNAVQPSCGHRLCEECARGLFARAGAESTPTCPRSDCGEQLVPDGDLNYFPDRFVRKEISNLKVRCYGHDNGCSWTGKLKDYEDHFKECLFVTKECEFCGHAFHVLELTSHMATCPKAGKQCPLMGLGCTAGRMPAPQLQKHCTELIAEHFHWLSVAVKDLQAQADKGQPHLRDIPEEDEGGDFQSSTNPRRGERSGDYDSGYGSFHGKTSHRPVDMEERDGGGSRPRTKERPMKLDLLKTEVADPFSGERRAAESFELRLSNAESASYNGTYCWKITEFEKFLSELRKGRVRFSVPFYYPSRYDYKMCLQLKIRSDDIHHLLLFFGIMKHDYDNILQWPFTHRVTFKLINQSRGQEITKTLQPNPSSSSFEKPKDYKPRIAKECPMSFPLAELMDNFVIDDTIFIRCQVQGTLTVDHFVGQRSMYEN